MNKPAKIALGCLLLPVGFTALAVVTLLAVKSAGVPDRQPATRELRQPLPEVASLPPAPAEPPATGIEPVPAREGMIVRIQLEQGFFRILPGPTGDGIRVDAEYDEGGYDLTQAYGEEGGRPVYHLRFESKVHWLRRALADGSFSDDDMDENHITVHLPRGVPMELDLDIDLSECEIDLSGLALVGLDVDMSMGEFDVVVDEENPSPLPLARFKGRMGEFGYEGLSRLRAAQLVVHGSMGDHRVDLDGELLTDTRLELKMRMGEMRVRLPEDALWDPHSRATVKMGEMDGSLDGQGTQDPEARKLLVRADVTFGSLVVDRYRSRALTREDR